MKRLLILTACSLALPALAAETATLLKDDSLRGKPFLDAPVQASLKRGTSVAVLKKQGAWAQIKAGSQAGWLRSLSLKSGKAVLPSSSLASVNSGRLGSGKIVNTTGIRGLDNEADGSKATLSEARFDAAALAKARALTVSSAEAASFAKAGKLKARPLGWLAEGAQ